MAKPTIFVIGAGIAGLACARVLDEAGFLVRIADKGRGPGGRCSSRRSPAGRFDHGAAFFTARDPDFQKALQRWIDAGRAAPWNGRYRRGGSPFSPDEPYYLGVRAMNAIIKHEADHLRAEFDLEIGPPTAGADLRFELSTNSGHQIGEADFVVIATPAPQAERLLPSHSPLKVAASAAELAPCWTLMSAMPDSAGDPGFDADFVGGPIADAVFWQPGRPGREGRSRFVLQASAEWSKAHLEDDPDDVSAVLSDELTRIVPGLPKAELSMVHRWRYARVEKVAEGDFGLDLENGLATCGDWHVGPRVECAWLSGHRLGQALSQKLG